MSFSKEEPGRTCLDDFEDIVGLAYDISDSAWKRFGYKPPSSSDAPSTRSSFESSTRSSSTADNALEAATSPNNVYQKKVLEDCYTAISTCNLFEKNELRSILVAAILPFFKKSLDECDGTQVTSGDALTFKASKAIMRPKKDRLQALLLGAAAMFDSSELDAYLADPKVKWVDDYRQAILNLPVTVNISAVDPTARQSRIVYSNAVQTGLFGSKKTQVGENLHELFSSNCSSSGVEQVARAVFSARKHKRGVLGTDNLCQLPVFDSQGQHAFTLGVESRPFEDPIFPNRVFGSDTPDANDEPFQQVEDLLLLLPLLIRTV